MPVIARANTDLEVNNTIAETDLFAANVPAGTLGTERKLIAILEGRVINNTASPTTIGFYARLGGTQLGAPAIELPASKTGPFIITARVTMRGADSQYNQVHIEFNPAADFDVSKNSLTESTTSIVVSSVQEFKFTVEPWDASSDIRIIRRVAILGDV